MEIWQRSKVGALKMGIHKKKKVSKKRNCWRKMWCQFDFCKSNVNVEIGKSILTEKFYRPFLLIIFHIENMKPEGIY